MKRKKGSCRHFMRLDVWIKFGLPVFQPGRSPLLSDVSCLIKFRHKISVGEPLRNARRATIVNYNANMKNDPMSDHKRNSPSKGQRVQLNPWFDWLISIPYSLPLRREVRFARPLPHPLLFHELNMQWTIQKWIFSSSTLRIKWTPHDNKIFCGWHVCFLFPSINCYLWTNINHRNPCWSK